MNKYSDIVDDWTQYADDRKTLYTSEQVLQKSHHAVLASGLYVDACNEWGKHRKK